jgi:hypothetical protein
MNAPEPLPDTCPSEGPQVCTWVLSVPVIPITELTFRHLATFLCFNAQGRYRTGLKSFQADFLAGLLAKTVNTFFNTGQTRVDLPQ